MYIYVFHFASFLNVRHKWTLDDPARLEVQPRQSEHMESQRQKQKPFYSLWK